MKYILTPKNFLDVALTLESGQAFRWQRHGDIWTGVVKNKVCRIVQDGLTVRFTGFTREEFIEYFDLRLDISEIYENTFSTHAEIRHLPQKYNGLRIMHQDLYECMLSFMLATNTSIPHIKSMIAKLSELCGEKIAGGYYAFPTPERILKSREKLCTCKLGYRERYIVEIARRIVDGSIELEKIKCMDYEHAVSELRGVNGIGNKVSDCICLFALKHYEAFPIDRHILDRVCRAYSSDNGFPALLKPCARRKITPQEYNQIGKFARAKFGHFAGYVQQYIFIDEIK